YTGGEPRPGGSPARPGRRWRPRGSPRSSRSAAGWGGDAPPPAAWGPALRPEPAPPPRTVRARCRAAPLRERGGRSPAPRSPWRCRRVWLRLPCRSVQLLLRDEVDDREDDDPDDVHEVPVEAGDLDALGIPAGGGSLPRPPPPRHQP